SAADRPESVGTDFFETVILRLRICHDGENGGFNRPPVLRLCRGKVPVFRFRSPPLARLLPKFISKKGHPFSAHLKLEKGKVGFEFVEKAPRVKKTPTKKAAVKAETYRRSRQTAGAFRGAASRRLT